MTSFVDRPVHRFSPGPGRQKFFPTIYHTSGIYNTLLNRMHRTEELATKTAAAVHREFGRILRGKRVELEMYHCRATGETWTR